MLHIIQLHSDGSTVSTLSRTICRTRTLAHTHSFRYSLKTFFSSRYRGLAEGQPVTSHLNRPIQSSLALEAYNTIGRQHRCEDYLCSTVSILVSHGSRYITTWTSTTSHWARSWTAHSGMVLATFSARMRKFTHCIRAAIPRRRAVKTDSLLTNLQTYPWRLGGWVSF